MNIRLKARKMLNFLTFLLIIICVSFSGCSLLTKVVPTARFHRTTTWTKTMTRNDTTTQFTPTTYSYQTTHQQSIQQHTEPCIQKHVHNTPSNVSYQTTYQITAKQHTIQHTKHQTTINQRAYRTTYQKTSQTYQTIWQTEQLAIIQQSTTWGYEK